jgi:hypothetical protein
MSAVSDTGSDSARRSARTSLTRVSGFSPFTYSRVPSPDTNNRMRTVCRASRLTTESVRGLEEPDDRARSRLAGGDGVVIRVDVDRRR